MNRFIVTILILFLPLSCCALFCPNNFNQINEGDTLEQVKNACGKPDKEASKEVTPETPQEWNYFIPQTVTNSAMAKVQGTLKVQFTFDANKKLINISANGIGVGSTNVCGKPISLGDLRDDIKSVCGNPAVVNQQDPGADSKIKVTDV